ncbi:NAD(P)/FAD-dependent oxidoreductase [Umezawaea sp. Da 62-37]|uniref:flavin-containing monooxygenase n=1 Tax=Umezawaea sp. Da 62-37 TaxID=3075927 RepID=UPI0028F72355|nr:NAD(P)/FAD-dependent oxidoreductase [Umezawaea sp. Da 62-37]WNV85255.1 NAD(P)/FAD-dependent oxidoreductase [Umezawaea sp. Da 62-37]
MSGSGERPIVIGAGPGGLAVAWTLKEAGLNPLVLDRENVACSSWYTYYPSLRMNSWRRLSSMPGMRLSAEYGPWPMRNDFINYMKKYIEVLDADIRHGTEVHRVDRDGDRWVVRTSIGDLRAKDVVVATGLHRKPFVPDWPGLDEFEGEFVHARSYTVPDPFVGKDVLVVGVGPTGIDIAIEVARAGASRVRLSVRHTPVLFKLSPITSLLSQAIKHGPMPHWLVNRISLTMHKMQWGDLTQYGLATPTEGTMAGTARSGHSYGSIDRGLIPAVREGAVEIVRGVQGFDKKAVLLDGQTNIKPDVVISATGQRPDMEGLLGHLGVLSQPGGRPVVFGGDVAPHAPGLYFQGYRLPPGQLPDMAVDARAIARSITGTRRIDLTRVLRSR